MQDQRLLTTSAPRCVGNTLLLNGRTYSPPYRITAIGDAAAMQSGVGGGPAGDSVQAVRGSVRPGLHRGGRRRPAGRRALRAAALALRDPDGPDRLLTSLPADPLPGRPSPHREAVLVRVTPACRVPTRPVAEEVRGSHRNEEGSRRREGAWWGRVTCADAGFGRRQLRQLRVQPGPIPGPAWCARAGLAQRRRPVGRRGPRRAGVRRASAEPRTGHPGARRRDHRPGARERPPQDPGARSVPGPSGDRRSLRRDGRPGPGTAARKDQHRIPSQYQCAAGTSGSVHGDPVSLTDDSS